MPWSKTLAYKLGLKKIPDPKAEFQGPDADKRIQNTLARNPSIGEDLKVVSEIMSVGEVVGFLRGEKIIEQDANTDDVFFLLTGEADIIVNGRKRSFRAAPNQVGEMAAIEPWKPRSATVQVRSVAVCGLRIPGEQFRTIWQTHADFKGRLQFEMASRHREQLAAAQVAKEDTSLLWSALSIGAATVAAGISWFSFGSAEWTFPARLVATGGVSIATLLVFLLQNPAFLWRRSFRLLLWCLVGKSFFDTSFTLEASQSFEDLQFELLSCVSAADIFSSLATSLPIVIVMAMCLWKDDSDL